MKISIEAVLHSLIFAESIFNEGHGCIIIERVLQWGLYNSVHVRTSTMMCLAEIVRLYYPHVHNNIEAIKELTFKIMSEDVDEVITLAIEVWWSLWEEEIYLKKKKEPCNNYVIVVFKELLKLMLNLLNDSSIEEDDDSDTWNKSTAAGCWLHLMAQDVGDEIILDVLEFVSGKIQQDHSWRDKYFGLLALGAILEGPSKDSLVNILTPAMNTLLLLFEDESVKVRETTAWFFSKVAQHHVELLGTESLFPDLYAHIDKGLKDDSRVAWNSASIVTELAKSLKPQEGQNGNILSNYYSNLVEIVLTWAYRTDDLKHSYGRSENKIAIAWFDALYSLFEYAPPNTEPFLLESLEHFFNKLKETNAKPLDDKAKDMQSFLWVWIQTIINRVECSLQKEVAESLVNVIIDWFKARDDVFEEGFLLISALWSKFKEHMEDYKGVRYKYIINTKCDKYFYFF